MLMDPKINTSNFSLVIAPQHDNLKGDNVISLLGSLHDLKPQETSRSEILSVFLGGDSAHYTYTHDDIQRLCHVIENELASKQSISVCITPSRRTQKHWVHLLRERFSDQPVEIWDGTGENPYVRYLNQAHKIIVTGDSISMMSETCRMGVPVYIFDVAIKHHKFKHFKHCLIDQNHARIISGTGPLSVCTPRILDEYTRIQPEIEAFIRLHFDS
jgi:mitochondrial fission protein ELM1